VGSQHVHGCQLVLALVFVKGLASVLQCTKM
jgi:hypothetical protein